MVRIRKREKGHKEYYYLEHTVKVGRKVEKREKYLGTKIPKDVEKIKSNFLSNIYREKWFSQFDKIKKNFSKEYSKMPKEVKEKYVENFMIKFTYDTNRIEGGTLTLKETANLLKYGITPKEKPIADVKETEAHKEVFYTMIKHKDDMNLRTVLDWHKTMFKQTKPNMAGKIRNYQVYVSGSRAEFPAASELGTLLKDFFRWYNKNKDKNKSSLHPAELAFLVHLKFVSIHPFGDGNGRISRLMMNFVLNKHGYPMLNVMYKNRSSYYTALERSNLKKQEYTFVLHMIKRYLKEYKKHLK